MNWFFVSSRCGCDLIIIHTPRAVLHRNRIVSEFSVEKRRKMKNEIKNSKLAVAARMLADWLQLKNIPKIHTANELVWWTEWSAEWMVFKQMNRKETNSIFFAFFSIYSNSLCVSVCWQMQTKKEGNNFMVYQWAITIDTTANNWQRIVKWIFKYICVCVAHYVYFTFALNSDFTWISCILWFRFGFFM